MNILDNYYERGRYEHAQDECEEEDYQGLLDAPDQNAGSGNIMVQLTQIDLRYETFPSINVLFNTYEI